MKKVTLNKLEVIDDFNKIRKVEVNGKQLIFEYPWYCKAYYQDGEACSPLLEQDVEYWYDANIYRDGEHIAHINESFYYYSSYRTIKLLMVLDFDLPEAIAIYRDMCCVKALLDGKKMFYYYDEKKFDCDKNNQEDYHTYLKNGGTPNKVLEMYNQMTKERFGLIPKIEAC